MGSNATPISPRLADRRVALVHDYLVHVRGGERVFEVLADLYPEADIYAFVVDNSRLPPGLKGRKIHSSFIQRLPFARRAFRLYFPLYPLAARTTKLDDYDLVISSSSAWAHAVSVGPRTTLVCYCHSPFRYIWDIDGPVPAALGASAPVWKPFKRWLQAIDLRAASRVDLYIANSEATRAKIERLYRRESLVIHPPADLDKFGTKAPKSNGDYYLVVSALMKYKRIDIAIEAFRRLGWPLKVVGTGEDYRRLRKLAGPNTSLIGRCSDEQLAALYAGCKALIVTSEEDFGIVPLEAMAFGRPVIAYKAGGAIETVEHGVTGYFYEEQTAEALTAVLLGADLSRLDSHTIRRHVRPFSRGEFQRRVGEMIRVHAR